jgi:hypothetical protein
MMADQNMVLESNRRKPNIFGMIKDIGLIVGFVIALATAFGWFGEVKTDVAVIKATVTNLEKTVDRLQNIMDSAHP